MLTKQINSSLFRYNVFKLVTASISHHRQKPLMKGAPTLKDIKDNPDLIIKEVPYRNRADRLKNENKYDINILKEKGEIKTDENNSTNEKTMQYTSTQNENVDKIYEGKEMNRKKDKTSEFFDKTNTKNHNERK